jgi:hypothetical protein
MAKYTKRTSEWTIRDLLGAKEKDAAGLDKNEHEIFMRQHRRYIDAYAKACFLSALEAQRPTLDLLRDSKRRPSLRRALDHVGPRRALKEEVGAGVHHALDDHIGNLRAGCDGNLMTPSYTTGEPLQEVFANNTVDLTNTFELSTHSDLAIPDQGKLSLGVGIGSFENWTHHLPFTSLITHPSINASTGMLAQYIRFPPAYNTARTILTVTVDVIVGDGSSPFFFVEATGPEPAGVFGELYLTLYEASSAEPHTEETRFLFHWEDMDGPRPPQTVKRSFSLSESLNLNANSSSALAVIDVYLQAFRYEDDPDRNSFAMVDLRSPDHDTHRIHFFVENTGPIFIPRISAILCPLPEAVR